MKRTEIYLTETQIRRIDEDKGGKSRSEVVRRIIDNHYEVKDAKGKSENDRD